MGVTYKSGEWLDAIGIICQRVNAQTGTLGNEFSRGPVGGSGGVAKISRCGDGYVIGGVRAQYGSYINVLYVYCMSWNGHTKASNPPKNNTLRIGIPGFASVGSRHSDHFNCPNNLVGKAFRGKHGSYIDSLRFVCDFWNK